MHCLQLFVIGASDGDFSWAVTNAMRAVMQRLSDIHSASVSFLIKFLVM